MGTDKRMRQAQEVRLAVLMFSADRPEVRLAVFMFFRPAGGEVRLAVFMFSTNLYRDRARRV